jgi:hypothetical protein
MWDLGTPPLELVARTVLVYAMFFGALRLFGKREVGQFTIFDLALILLAANALQPALTGPDQSIPCVAIIIVTMFALNRTISLLRVPIPSFERLLEFQPTVIGRDGRWLQDVMAPEGIDLDDAVAALREHTGSTGSISSSSRLSRRMARSALSRTATGARRTHGGVVDGIADRSDAPPGDAGPGARAGRRDPA